MSTMDSGRGPSPQTADAPLAEHVWECRYCKMLVSSLRAGFAPPPEYAGVCTRNSDDQDGHHDWHLATAE